MEKIKEFFINFLRDEEGASATEYAVLIVLIIVVALAAILALGGEVSEGFQKVADEIAKHNT